MATTNPNVLFYKATREKYIALVEKNPFAIYFVEDIPAIYVGDVLFAVGSEVTSEFSGLMTPEMKAKLDSLVESGGDISSKEIQSIWDAIALKANTADVYTKQEVDNIVTEATADVVTSEELDEVKNDISTLETKVEASIEDIEELQGVVEQKADVSAVTELQEAVEQKADVAVVEELQNSIEQKADIKTITELQTIVEQKVDTETVELLETELKTYVETKIIEITKIDDGEI